MNMDPVSLYALLMVALLLKHLVADLPLQTTYMALNKGTYGHPGGLYHAAIHGAGSLTVLWFFSPYLSAHLALFIIALEVVIHYHIDFLKMKYEKQANFSHLVYDAQDPQKVIGLTITHMGYYYFFVIDQALHFATYIAMGWALIAFS